MEKLQFGGKYSFKNITTPGKEEYMKQLVYSMEQFLRRMRWRAYHFLKNKGEDNENNIDDEDIETSKFSSIFRSPAKPPFIKEMEAFEKEFLEVPKKLEYRKFNNMFQREMKEDLKKMKTNDSKKVIIAADKTRNYYKCDLPTYEKMVTENISKEYKKANETELNEVNLKAAKIAKKEKLENRMLIFTPGESYITIKDHKTDFPGKFHAV